MCGYDKVLGSWSAIFQNTQSIRFDLADLAIAIRGETAVVTNVENIHSDAGGQTYLSTAVATNVYRFREGQWKLMLHHASPVVHHGFNEMLEGEEEADEEADGHA